MHPILDVAVANTLIAAILAVVAWIAGKLFRRPALTHGLWLLVLVKLVTPPIWSIPLKLAKPAGAKPLPVMVRHEPKSLQPSFIETVKGETGPTASHRVVSTSEWLPAAALSTWAAGSMVCAAVAVSRLRRFARLLRCAAPAPPDVRERADELALRLGLGGSPVVYFLPAGVSPMLFGLGRGLRLLVPQRLWEKLDDDERSSLLLHELAHLRRRDHWVRGFELLVTMVYWWNPLAWWARRELRAAEELCCDAWVTWSMPAAADAYARALVEAVDFMCVSRSRPVLPAMASGIGAFRHLKRRLVMIQQRQGSRGLGWAGAAGVALAAMVLPLSLTRAQDEKPARQPQSASPTTRPQDRDKEKATTNASDSENSPEYRAMRAQLDRNLPECNFDTVSLVDVIDFLRDVSGANIFVNWKALADAGVDKNAVVTLRIRNIRLGDALDLVLTSAAGKRHKLGYDVKGGAINISTTADLGGSALVVTRTYGVQDLVGGKDDRRGDELVKMITGSIDASSWAENGGTTGTVKIDDGKLIVAQTPENQEAVKNLIKHARELMKK